MSCVAPPRCMRDHRRHGVTSSYELGIGFMSVTGKITCWRARAVFDHGGGSASVTLGPPSSTASSPRNSMIRRPCDAVVMRTLRAAPWRVGRTLPLYASAGTIEVDSAASCALVSAPLPATPILIVPHDREALLNSFDSANEAFGSTHSTM